MSFISLSESSLLILLTAIDQVRKQQPACLLVYTHFCEPKYILLFWQEEGSLVSKTKFPILQNNASNMRFYDRNT